MIRLPSSIALSLALTASVLAGPATAASSNAAPVPRLRIEPGSRGLAGAYLAARHAEANADSNTATAFLERALILDPDNQQLLRQAFFTAAQAGDFARALPAAKRAMDSSRQQTLAALVVALGHFKKGEYELAGPILEKMSLQSQVGFALPMLRAWADAPHLPVERSLSELAPLNAPNGATDLYNVMSAMINEFYGRGPQALTYYDILGGKIDQLPLSLVRLVSAGYMRLGQPEKVKAMTDKYRATHGASPFSDDYLDAFADPKRVPKKITPQDGMGEAMFAAAQMLLQNANTSFSAQLAVVYGQAALYMNPDLGIARRIMGAALAQRSHFEESNAILSSIKKGEPGYIAVQMQLADNYERMNRAPDALAMLQRIAKEEPSWPESFIAIGDHLRREKKFAEAVDAYDRAFKLYPKGEPTSWQLYYARGIALERIKQFDRSYKDFRQAIKLNPDDAGLLNYLGYSLVERNVDVAEGRQLIEKAFKLKPEDGYIIDSLGWAMFLMGETEKAVAQLEKAVESNPSDPTINEHLGDAYWKIGRRQEAMFQWRRALTLEPEDRQRSEIQSKLAQGLARNDTKSQ